MKRDEIILLVLAVLVLCGLKCHAQISVASYGSVGDEVQFNVNCTSNSTTFTTSNAVLTSAAIGDFIEVVKAGPQTIGINNAGVQATNNQDLIAVINNVVNGTNITISLLASNTLVNATATYGFNNDAAFQSAILAAASANASTTITIPAGNYLFIATNLDTRAAAAGEYYSVYLPQGGITFNGAGTNSTRLIGQGAWQIKGTAVWRGFMFDVFDPTNINQSLVFQNLTLDGGLQNAYSHATNAQSFPANKVDGLGWDQTHDAFVVNSTNNFPQDIVNTIFTNVLFAHWAGEVTKELDNATNNNFLFISDGFNDDNADCVNTVGSTSVSNSVFNNVFQPMEYNTSRRTNLVYFVNNFATNCSRGIAINSSMLNPPWFNITGNSMYVSNNGGYVVDIAVIQNLLFSNNLVVDQGYDNFVQFDPLSAFKNQSPQHGVQSSNLFFINNTISSFANDLVFLGGSTATSTDSVFNVHFDFNTILNTHTNYGPIVVADYGWHTNVFINGNDFSSFNNPSNYNVGPVFQPNLTGTPPPPNPYNSIGQYAFVGTNNLYYSFLINGGSNENITYGYGSRFVSINSPANSSYTLGNADALNIPGNAKVLFLNQNTNSVTLHLNSIASPAIAIPGGTSIESYLVNGSWFTNSAGVVIYINNFTAQTMTTH